MACFQILSLIGGGIRGAFITAFLDRIEQKSGRPIAESFDLIAGTSTGGIIAAGLAMGKPAAEMHEFYAKYGAMIFTPRPRYKAKGIWKLLFPVANHIFRRKTGGGLDAAFRARFCPHALQAAFDEGFGDATMREVDFTRLIIPTFNLTSGQPYVFRSPHLPKGFYDQDLKVSDVVIAATAAPTYFPHRVIAGQSYIDGGVWAADPSMLAFAEAIRIGQFARGVSPQEQTIQNDRDVETAADSKAIHDAQMSAMSEIRLLSIGTGRAQFSLSPPGADAGLLYWAPRVAEVMGTSQVQGIHQPLKFLLGDRYRHINFKMKERWPLDAVQHIPELFRMGVERADQSSAMIDEEFLSHQRQQFVRVENASGATELNEFGFE
ncbi:patatin-like phospholipase family protein [Rosistilla oblonga]|uniref:patatin-like phospholipase family protein n=1 Tax=Rosistilla oblonga TaxID=2527990 RepID=UPI003A9807DA